jgi:transcriptional regulator with XRE-family HTH domain
MSKVEAGDRPSRTARKRPVEVQVGQQLRAKREEAGLGLRELARRIGISASALHQIETGKSRPSMSTLFAIARELHLSLDELFDGTSDAAALPPPPPTDSTPSLARPPLPEAMVRSAHFGEHVQRVGTRPTIEMQTAVRWERLTPPNSDPNHAFLWVVYDVGGTSSTDNALIRHGGCEYGLVLSGTLEVTVDGDTYELGPGDSIAFDSTVPHRVRNIGDEPAHGVWVGIADAKHRARPPDEPTVEQSGRPGDNGATARPS